jgi:hypothetical protein
MRTAEILDIEGEFYYHGRVQSIKKVEGKNINVTEHLLEDKSDGSMVLVALDKIRFKDAPINREQRK